MNGLIIKDDARYDYCEDFLKNSGHTFDANAELGFVIFPFMKPPNPIEYRDEFFARLNKNTLIFSGVTQAELSRKCIKYGLAYYPMIEERSVATKNAVPTSEGVIAYLIANRNETIAGSRILVLGYGVCGADLCKRLKALGANVYAMVRKDRKSVV